MKGDFLRLANKLLWDDCHLYLFCPGTVIFKFEPDEVLCILESYYCFRCCIIF
jgi:hypothetical protein